MKIILSRKGFDSTAGGVANPILPDGTLLSLPIPAKYDELAYADLQYGGVSYSEILSQLKPRDKKIPHWNCHLDPDIRPDARISAIENWQAGFGQIGAFQTYLSNQGVTIGDLFLFFGWFRQTEGDLKQGSLRYVKGAPDLHVVYGYLQIGAIITDSQRLRQEYWFHPHGIEKRASQRDNAIYLPAQTLSFKNQLPAYGMFKFSEKRVLTKSECTRAIWQEVDALQPENICRNVKNSSKKGGLYYKGQWQELVLKENTISTDWARRLFDL